MKFEDFEIGTRAFKIIEKVSADEFELIGTASTIELARELLQQLNAERNGCFFIRYPKWALKVEPGRVFKKKPPKQYYAAPRSSLSKY